jgi:hypothetical protein
VELRQLDVDRRDARDAEDVAKARRVIALTVVDGPKTSPARRRDASPSAMISTAPMQSAHVASKSPSASSLAIFSFAVESSSSHPSGRRFSKKG